MMRNIGAGTASIVDLYTRYRGVRRVGPRESGERRTERVTFRRLAYVTYDAYESNRSTIE